MSQPREQRRTQRRSARLLFLLGGLLAFGLWAPLGHAADGVEFRIRNRTILTAHVAPGQPTARYTFDAPAGALIDVNLRAIGPREERLTTLNVRLYRPNGELLTTGNARVGKAKIRRFALPTSGRYSIEVLTDGADAGPFRLKVRWRSRRVVRLATQFDTTDGQVTFSAPAGSRADFRVRGGEGEESAPRMTRIQVLPNGEVVAAFDPPEFGEPHRVRRVPLPATGDYALSVTTDPATGADVETRIRFRFPRIRTQRLDLSALEIAQLPGAGSRSGDGPIYVVDVGDEGGRIESDDAAFDPLRHVRLDIPVDALSETHRFILSEGLELPAPSDDLLAAGPPVHIEPAALTFATPATLVIPYDTAGSIDPAELVVVQRDGAHVTTVISEGIQFDVATGTLTFPISSLGTFQAFVPQSERFLTATDFADGLAVSLNPENGQKLAFDGQFLAIGRRSTRAPDDRITGVVEVLERSNGAWSAAQTLYPENVVTASSFGSVLAMDGNTLVVGDMADNQAGSFSGAAYVFVRSGSVWTLQQRIVPADSRTSMHFAWAVAISGDTAFFSATGRGDEIAGVYVFTRSNGVWTERTKILRRAGAVLAGYSIAADGNTLLVAGHRPGQADIYVGTGADWDHQATLTPGEFATGNEGFGFTCALEGDTAVVGDIFGGVDGPDSGAVFVFRRAGTTWTREARLLPDDRSAAQRLGAAVAIDGDTILAGAIGIFSTTIPQGAAYFFERDENDGTWRQIRKTEPTEQIATNFGSGVTLHRGSAVVSGTRGPLTLIE